jgi:hypothetical protein
VPIQRAPDGEGSRFDAVNHLIEFEILFIPGDGWLLTFGTKEEQCSSYVLTPAGGMAMLKIFVEEAAALASISLFVGMIAVWAQLIPQL